MDVDVIAGDNEVTFEVTLDPEATGVVLIDVDGVGYYANVTDGKAKLTIKGLKPDNYDVCVIYPGDDKFNNATQTKSFTITQEIPTPRIGTYIEVDPNFTRVANDFYNAGEKGAMFYGVLKDTNGNVLPNKTVQITVNGVIYNVTTDSQGRAGLEINLVSEMYILMHYSSKVMICMMHHYLHPPD